ncbi:MAG: O-antigen ligase family protein [Candidatus Aminicenantes bacterium]|nr:O-antigen ligase family protein [Candidatus Aminicenantes bacterium]
MRSTSSLNSLAFALLLAFLFLIDISIAGCYVLLTVILLIFLLHLLRGGEFPKLPFYCYFFAAYVFFTLLATVFSVDRAVSIRDNKELLIFLLIPFYLWLLDSWKRVWLSIWTVLGAAVFSSLVGIGTVLAKGFGKGVLLADRLRGFTSHWMTYAGLLLFPFIFYFVLLILLERKTKRALTFSGALLVMLAAIAFSLTRNVWLGIVASLALFIVFFKPRHALALAPVLVVLVLLAPAVVRSRVLSIVDLNDSSNRDRIYMAYSGVRLFQDRPWTGVGSGNIEKAIAGNETRYRHPQADRIYMHLHNNFLQILAERGLFALASFLLACLAIILQLLRMLRSRTGEWRAITAGVLFAFIGFLIAGMFEYNFGDSEIKFLLFYFLSLPFLSLKGENHVHSKTNP